MAKKAKAVKTANGKPVNVLPVYIPRDWQPSPERAKLAHQVRFRGPF